MGGALFTVTDCTSPAGAGGCPSHNITANEACGGAGQPAAGAACPGTNYCNSLEVNKSCATIATNNPIWNWACAVNPVPPTCNESTRACVIVAGIGTCSGFNNAAAAACGTVTDCWY